MRLIVRAAPVALALALFATGAGAQAPAGGASTKLLAFVDSRVIMQQAPGRTEAEAQFEKEVGTYRTQVQKISDSLSALEKAFSSLAPTLSATAREAREKDLQKRGQEMQDRARQMESQMQQRQYELLQPIMDNIRKVLDDVRAAEGYAAIIDIGAQGNPLVAFDKNLDITERVVARLKASPPPAAAKPAGPMTAPAGAPLAAPAGVTRPTKPPTR